jgi:hypothetical protein
MITAYMPQGYACKSYNIAYVKAFIDACSTLCVVLSIASSEDDPKSEDVDGPTMT